MHAILVPMGSYGDVHPFIGLGRELQRRGHDVTVITSAYFEDLTRKAGLDFVPLGAPEDYLNAANNPDLWHPTRGLGVVSRLLVSQTKTVYEEILNRRQPGNTVLVAAGMAFGARIAQEVHNVPLATIHLQPICLLSEHETSVPPAMALMTNLPRFFKRMAFGLADINIQRLCGGPLNEFRESLGLEPVRRRILFDWWHSPQRVVGLFPEWFARPQPDWPTQTRLTGFPLYDEADLQEPDPELESFLAKGEPPVVFTPGSGNLFGQSFFQAAVEACQRTGRRGILLSRYTDHLPAKLPSTVRHFAFVPFSKLLNRSAALVHHGGIGTTSQALNHGVPQLIMPLSHDQPDNAARIRRLGVGSSIHRSSFKGRRVARELTELLKSADIKHQCRIVSERMQHTQPLQQTVDLVEELADC